MMRQLRLLLVLGFLAIPMSGSAQMRPYVPRSPFPIVEGSTLIEIGQPGTMATGRWCPANPSAYGWWGAGALESCGPGRDTYAFQIAGAEDFDVHIWTAISYRYSSRAFVRLTHRDGMETFALPERYGGATWQILGSVTCPCIIYTDDRNGRVSANAVLAIPHRLRTVPPPGSEEGL